MQIHRHGWMWGNQLVTDSAENAEVFDVPPPPIKICKQKLLPRQHVLTWFEMETGAHQEAMGCELLIAAGFIQIHKSR